MPPTLSPFQERDRNSAAFPFSKPGKEVKRAACIQEPERPQGGIGNFERRAGWTGECAGAFLFLREGRTEGLWPKSRGLLEKWCVRAHISPGRGAACRGSAR